MDSVYGSSLFVAAASYNSSGGCRAATENIYESDQAKGLIVDLEFTSTGMPTRIGVWHERAVRRWAVGNSFLEWAAVGDVAWESGERGDVFTLGN